MKIRTAARLIAPLLSIAAAMTATATAHAAPPPANADWSQEYITESDGTKLHVDVLRPKGMPKDASSKTPVILSIGPYFNHSGQTGPAGPVEDTPYNPLTANGPSDRFYDYIEGSHLLDRGYTWVQVDLRGFGGSSGCLDWAGPGEQADVKAAVEWAASRPWSTGKVGMYGKSYDAVTGLVGIGQQPKGLAAVVAQEPVYDLYRYLYMNRVRYLNSLATPALYDAIAGTPGPLLGSGETNSGDILAYNSNSINDTARPGCPVFNHQDQQQSDHNAPYWKPRNIISELRGKKTPLFLTQGLLENNTKPDGVVDAFNAVKGPKRAWLGMWQHVRGNETDPNTHRLMMGRKGWFDETMRFYDRYLKGAKPTVKDPTVARESNDGRWFAEKAWPPRDAFPLTTRLKPGAYSDDGQNSGNNDSSPNSGTFGVGIWTISPPLDHVTRITGTPHIDVVSDATEGANLYADVYDIGIDRHATLISRGAYLMDNSGKASFDLYDQDWTLPPNHRIGVLVTGSNSEWWTQPPSGQNVNVKSSSITLPYAACANTQRIQGSPSPRLESYLSDSTFTVDDPTIADATDSAFALPATLAKCAKPKPGKRACVDRRKFRFTIDQPRKGRIVKVVAYVNGKRRLVKRGHRVTQVTLKRLPKKTFKVRIVATANNGQRTISVRTYRGCRKSRPHTHVVKPHRH